MSGRVTLPAICLALALTAVSTDARASDAAAAQALFEEGRALMAKGDYVTACTKLEGSQALDPGPGTQYNLALCYEKGAARRARGRPISRRRRATRRRAARTGRQRRTAARTRS